MVKQFIRCRRWPCSRQLLTDGITMRFIKSVRALTKFLKSRRAHVAETASEERRKLARNYLQNRRKLIRNCLQNWRKLIKNGAQKLRKTHQKLSSKREKGQQNLSPQYWRKFERYFLAKSEKA
jgi:predicted  nucleic acid-binding Zn-ribbon protein